MKKSELRIIVTSLLSLIGNTFAYHFYDFPLPFWGVLIIIQFYAVLAFGDAARHEGLIELDTRNQEQVELDDYKSKLALLNTAKIKLVNQVADGMDEELALKKFKAIEHMINIQEPLLKLN